MLNKLLRYPTSKSETPISLATYMENMKADQKAIYYVQAPTRAIAEESPFAELFKKEDVEVLYLHNTVDEFVTQHLTSFEGKDVVSVEKGRHHLHSSDDANTEEAEGAKVAKEEWTDFQSWATSTMGSSLGKATMSLKVPMSVPAVLIDHGTLITILFSTTLVMNADVSIETPAMRNLMRQLKTGPDAFPVAPNNVEFNARHPIIIGLQALRTTEPETAKKVLEQVVDNAVIAAGLMEDPRVMLRRLNGFLEEVVAAKKKSE